MVAGWVLYYCFLGTHKKILDLDLNIHVQYCDLWTHAKCCQMSVEEYGDVSEPGVAWFMRVFGTPFLKIPVSFNFQRMEI